MSISDRSAASGCSLAAGLLILGGSDACPRSALSKREGVQYDV
jgi:hypothetical protein